jgi:hypothetical protein
VNRVKKNKLTKIVTIPIALALASSAAFAEDKYPASDFQPKVVYQDEAAVKQSPSSTSAVSKPSSASRSSDSQYPAANFEPKVLYKDESYQHDSTVPNGSSSSAVSSGSEGASVVAAKEESSAGYILGLLVFAIAGFVLFKRGGVSAGTGKSAASSAAKNTSGLTGVAKYMLRKSGTGVSRYLEAHSKNAPSSATGVARYLAKQGPSSKAGAAQKVTGVEKYMRNKG